MVQTFGFLDTQYIDFLDAQNEAAIRETNRAGVSYEELFRILDGGLSALANSRDPLIEKYVQPTTQRYVSQRFGSNRIWQRGAEYTPGRPQLGQEAEQYELPIWSFEVDLGTTRRALRDMGREDFTSEVRDTIQSIAKGHRADVLERMFFKTEFPLDSRAMGGKSPGFAGAGNPDITGVDIYGKDLPANYTHYFHGTDVAANIRTALDGAIAAMERWHRGRLEIMPTEDMADRIATWTTDEDFVPAQEWLIRSAVDRPEALVNSDTYLGVYKFKYPVLKPEAQLTGINAAIVPAALSRKPLAWRYNENWGREVRSEDRSLFPLTELIIMQDYGIGVLDRVGMALVSAGAGANYINPGVDR